MTAPRFLQIHTLTSYTAALLNRDDDGLAKRLPYGGVIRTRVSSQCLKRHWRHADDPHGFSKLQGFEGAVRSRDLVSECVVKSLSAKVDPDISAALVPWFQWAVYSGNKKKAPKKLGEAGGVDAKQDRQTIILGEPELAWLRGEFERLAKQAGTDAQKAFEIGKTWAIGESKSKSKLQDEADEGENSSAFRAAFTKNFQVLRDAGQLPGGLASALFGRMVTSDPEANITAPVHVAHTFTVHGEEAENDYFTAVDDLAQDEPGADTIQETELTSGLFYGYVVVDLPGLIDNLGGDCALAGQVLHNLIYLIAEVSPGAKLGSTAPYGRAGLMMLEAGDRQPRSLAEAFRHPCPPHLGPAAEALAAQLIRFDNAYATGEERIALSLANAPIPRAAPGTLRELAEWAGALPGRLA